MAGETQLNEYIDFHIPDCDEFRRGYEIYNERENRGRIYFEALTVVLENWGNPEDMAKGVGIIIRGWNYLYSNYDFNGLVSCINAHLAILNDLRYKNIEALSDDDGDTIKDLFIRFNEALKRQRDGRRSPVSVAKTLCLFAPNFFPLWDRNIAFEYDCFYFSDSADGPYIRFCKKMKILAEHVKNYVPCPDDRSVLKRIDEYNYSKYTMHWIRDND